MRDIQEVWDNGACQEWRPYRDMNSYVRTKVFAEKTGAKCVVEFRWQCNGSEVRVPYPCTVLPDQTGVVLMDEWHFQGQPMEGPPPWPSHLRVINADGSLRYRFYAPVAAGANALDSWAESPKRYPQAQDLFGVHVFDGRQDRLLEVDWETGTVIREVPVSYSLRY